MADRDAAILEALFWLNEERLIQLLRGVDTRAPMRLYTVNVQFLLGNIVRAIDIKYEDFADESLVFYLTCYHFASHQFRAQYELLIKVLALSADEATHVLNQLVKTCGLYSDIHTCADILIRRTGARYTGSTIDLYEQMPFNLHSMLTALVEQRNEARRHVKPLLAIIRRHRRQTKLPWQLIKIMADVIWESER